MAKETTLDDIAESIADLATMIATQFIESEKRMTTRMDAGFAAVRKEIDDGFAAVRKEMAGGFAEVHRNQRDTNVRLDKLEMTTGGLDEDVLKLYRLVERLRKDLNTFSAMERRRFAELEAFALQVAEQTGIPYNPTPNPKSKRRS